MKKVITKKSKYELENIIKKHGYWSDEYSCFLELFHYNIRYRVHELARYYEKN